MEYRDAYDPIPLEDVHETHGPNDAGMMTHQFYAFNTIITLQAYADAAQCAPAFDAARAASRAFERRLSRTLPHSDISRLNAAAGKRVAVCGTGPTALSILHACAIAGADVAMLVGRDKERSRKVLEGYVERFGLLANATVDLPAAQAHHRSFRTAYERTTFKFGSYTTSTKALAAADLVVNATPLGMNEGDGSPFDVELLSAGQTVFDAVYGHGETALVRAAREAGCTVHDGAGMLVAQAVATVHAVCDLAEVDVALSDDELFALMAEAAGFDL